MPWPSELSWCARERIIEAIATDASNARLSRKRKSRVFVCLMDQERRTLDITELRASIEGGMKITGYAARFNSTSSDLGGFVEQIAPGAFRRALASQPDVRALFNHDPNYVIGRTKAGTLKLREDAKGLWMEAAPPETQWAKDLVTSIARGDISQMSFGFSVPKGGDLWTRQGEGVVLRTVLDADLFDVSAVTYPAYDSTSVSVTARSAAAAMQQTIQEDPSSGERIQEDERRRQLLRIAQADS